MKKIFFFISLIFFVACNEKKESRVATHTISLDTDVVSSLDLSKIASLKEVVVLETTNKSIIERMGSVHLIDSLILVWDLNRKVTLAFNRDGKFLHQIGRIGRAKGEYIDARSMQVDTKARTVSVLDNVKKEIISYNLKGEYIGSQSIGSRDAFAYTLCDNLLWTLSYGTSKERSVLLAIDTNHNKCVNHFFPVETFNTLLESNYFYSRDNAPTLFHYSYNNSIWEIDSSGLNELVRFDFDEKFQTQSIDKHSPISALNNVFESNGRVFFSFLKNKEQIHGYADLYSEDQNALLYTLSVKHNSVLTVAPLPVIINISQNKLIYQIVPSFLNNMDNLNKMKAVKESAYAPISRESNPILVMYELLERK